MTVRLRLYDPRRMPPVIYGNLQVDVCHGEQPPCGHSLMHADTGRLIALPRPQTP